jgi:hypothetical protein
VQTATNTDYGSESGVAAPAESVETINLKPGQQASDPNDKNFGS